MSHSWSPTSASPPFDPWRAMAAAGEVVAAGLAGPAALERLRGERLAALVAAAGRSPLYAPLLAGRPPGDWRLEQLPVLAKSELMARFDDWVTDRAIRLADVRAFLADRSRIACSYLGRYAVWESSGSTGTPGVFVNDAASLAVQDALEALRRSPRRPWARLADPCFVGERIAFAGAVDGHFASTASMERLRRLNPLVASRLAILSFLQPVDALAAQLEAFQPTILATYPSMATILAEERLAGRLRIAPREVWTGGETLTPGMRALVGEAFGCPVANDYGCSEFLALATECAAGRLHLNADWAILEPVDAEGRPVKAGRFGTRCLLTNLANHVQPLIRYDLGDRVRFVPERCRCGSALPAIEVQGREDDLVELGAGEGVVRLSPLALTTVLEDDAGLHEFQLVQRGACRLELRTRADDAEARRHRRRAHDALLAFVHAQGARGVRIACRSAEPIRQARSGKVKRVVVATAQAA